MCVVKGGMYFAEGETRWMMLLYYVQYVQHSMQNTVDAVIR